MKYEKATAEIVRFSPDASFLTIVDSRNCNDYQNVPGIGPCNGYEPGENGQFECWSFENDDWSQGIEQVDGCDIVYCKDYY